LVVPVGPPSEGGFTLYVKDRHLHYTTTGSDANSSTSPPTLELTPGRHALRYEFEPHGQPDLAQGHGMPGRFQLYIDGELAGDMEVPYTTPFAITPAP